MKKFSAILFALLMSGAMVSLTISSHSCGGVIVKSNASFSGTLASCGMEKDNESCPVGSHHIKSPCCKTFVIKYSTDKNYISPGQAAENKRVPGHIIIPLVAMEGHQYKPVRTSVLFTSHSPPDAPCPSIMILAQVCVLRI